MICANMDPRVEKQCLRSGTPKTSQKKSQKSSSTLSSAFERFPESLSLCCLSRRKVSASSVSLTDSQLKDQNKKSKSKASIKGRIFHLYFQGRLYRLAFNSIHGHIRL